MSTASTLLDQRTAKSCAAPGLRLIIMTPDLCSSRSIEANHVLLVGRAADADVVLQDARASRKHARLFADEHGLAIEDLGSANGTRLRDQKLKPHERVSFSPGEAVAIGRTILMVVPDTVEPARRTLLSHEDFESRVEWEAKTSTHGRTCMRSAPRSTMRLQASRRCRTAGRCRRWPCWSRACRRIWSPS